MVYPFASFLAAHGVYRQAYEQLAAADALLARSARTVVEIQGQAFGAVAEPILEWVAQSYGANFVSDYVQRVTALNRLQERFQAAPSPGSLGDATLKVSRTLYDLTLLLSFVYSNHRFEILRALKEFLRHLPQAPGRLASVGIGTGYELYVIAEFLRGWAIEGYDVDDEARRHAVNLLRHFAPDSHPQLQKLFPLGTIDETHRRRFDAIVMCELLEHLSDPLGALETAREYLVPGGLLFVTMAINIAQEDHIFLYESVSACQRQLLRARLSTVREWLIPVTSHPAMLKRQGNLAKGNYVAMVRA